MTASPFPRIPDVDADWIAACADAGVDGAAVHILVRAPAPGPANYGAVFYGRGEWPLAYDNKFPYTATERRQLWELRDEFAVVVSSEPEPRFGRYGSVTKPSTSRRRAQARQSASCRHVLIMHSTAPALGGCTTPCRTSGTPMHLQPRTGSGWA